MGVNRVSTTPIYIDLLISDDDLQTNRALAVESATDRVVIAQDIRHAIRESGIVLPLIGMRDPIIIQRILTDLELLVEQDTRLVPGTINMAMPHHERIIMWAKTRDFGDLEVQYGL
ncbi:DUF2590 domain-containing protein [Pseudoalteromonas ruthenica]|uniref:DUF2590 domain-containing protein n=1 Tax=Pseudoalteromonas ruthenica TaxID=151081 RepID=A0A5S3Z8D0_9GAMM|nr:DUF2590 domain-containing protein [Pseudoalteromonas ruthenica]TMP88514.1 DUF2590 domain-containing protein [Pseudoalteromonas ruthenica]